MKWNRWPDSHGISGRFGVEYARIYGETAKAINELKLTTVKEIVNAITTLPVDSVFKAAFSSTAISKQALARYYLRCLEEQVDKDNIEQVPCKDTTRVNLEHILPLTITNKWLKTWQSDEAKAYQRRLGNLALMASKSNSISGNDDFSSKKIAYKESNFLLTKQLAEYEDWNKESIEKRQLQMADLALKIWTVKV